MKRFVMIAGSLLLLAGCGKDSKENPGAPVEWNKNPKAPKSYGDPSTGPLGAPGKNGQPPVPGRK